MTRSAGSTDTRSPLVVSDRALLVGEKSHEVTGDDGSEALLLAYLDFLSELRSTAPTIGSLRSGDIEVLSSATGMDQAIVRATLVSMLSTEEVAPVRLTRRARSAAFSFFGVAVVGGGLTLAATLGAPASVPVASQPTPAARLVSAQIIDRTGSQDISGPYSVERPSQSIAEVKVGNGITIERR